MNKAQLKRHKEILASSPKKIEGWKKKILLPTMSLLVSLRMEMGEKEFMRQMKTKADKAIGMAVCYIATGKKPLKPKSNKLIN